MPAPQNIISVIFDFDDTLTDDSTTRLLEAYGIDPEKFWSEELSSLVRDQWDPPLAYLRLILDKVGDGRPFGRLTNKGLREFGKHLTFYQGVPDLFNDLIDVTKPYTRAKPSVEFYIISGGLEEIIRGSSVEPYMQGIWGCHFMEDDDDGPMVKYIKNVISFTDKTRHIFEINKGIVEKSRKQPYAVNESVEDSERRVPFRNMIYVGDGLTDVPCFSLIQRNGGKAFGIFDPTKEGDPKKKWQKLAVPKRVANLNSPRYGKTDDLGWLLRAAVDQICQDIEVRTRTA